MIPEAREVHLSRNAVQRQPYHSAMIPGTRLAGTRIEPKPLIHDSYHESDVGHVAENCRSEGSGLDSTYSGGDHENAVCRRRVSVGKHRRAGSVHVRVWRTYHSHRSGSWNGFDPWGLRQQRTAIEALA